MCQAQAESAAVSGTMHHTFDTFMRLINLIGMLCIAHLHALALFAVARRPSMCSRFRSCLEV